MQCNACLKAESRKAEIRLSSNPVTRRFPAQNANEMQTDRHQQAGLQPAQRSDG